ncbi:LD-carboxypeptidase [Mobilitalea sibirica]|uniref:LD-carboxypeptidase n=1 Tax=Mobilitalea sibirica TaxID=1462919 RepID=A0A8J7HCI3_9FIRM|nr:S66 peptidase family protein [Mobilitalea sibirica]MBH1942116.1 LD-carboxypeptidase [Mobilitalea sibirica]
MTKLIKPQHLKPGDKIATVSLSWGGAGDPELLWRYQLGKERLQDLYGFHIVEMPNTLKGSDYLYRHPEKRAQDLLDAFADPSIKGIFSCIGGDDSVRMLPFIDFEIIRKNPKVFLGYSDSTITHFICLKAGLSSFYGASILAEFAENIQVYEYTSTWIQKVLCDPSPIGEIPAATMWTGERMPWLEENMNKAKKLLKNQGYEFLQGTGKVQGHLIGGCIEVLEMMKGTTLWPSDNYFKDAILFFETSEDMPDPSLIIYWLRNYGTLGILQNAKAVIWGKPYQEKYYDEYKASIKKVIIDELGLTNLPIIYNMTFGHIEPMTCLPFGALAEIDCDNQTFSILESGVI